MATDFKIFAIVGLPLFFTIIGVSGIQIIPFPKDVTFRQGDNATVYFQLRPWPPPCCKWNHTDGEIYRHVLVRLSVLPSHGSPEKTLCGTEYNLGKWDNSTGKCSEFGEKRMLDFYPDYNDRVSFTLTNITLYDQGRYKLVIDYTETVEDYINMRIIDTPPLPVMTSSRGNDTLNVGDEVVITCTVSVCSPPPTLQWWKVGSNGGSQPLDPLDDQYADDWQGESWSRIKVGPVTWREHGKPYTCIAENPAGSSQNSLSLVIRHAPNLVLEPCVQTGMKYRVIEGQDARLLCDIHAYPQHDVITWAKDQQNYPSTYNDTGFLVNDVTAASSGNYSCSTFNSVGESTATCVLDVLYGCRISLVEEVTVKEGQPVSVECHVDANPAASSIVWTRQNDADFMLEDATLHIPAAEAHHADAYRCTATNTMVPSFGSPDTYQDTKELRLHVEHTAKWMMYAWRKFAATEGSNGKLQCKINAYPAPSFHWTHNRNDITSGVESDVFSSNLTVTGVSSGDYGTYTCHVTNSEGQVTFDIQLSRPGKPDSAQACSQYNVSATQVTHVCIDGYDGGEVTWYEAETTSGRRLTTHSFHPNADSTAITVTGLQPKTNYTLRLYTHNKHGRSASAVNVQFITHDGVVEAPATGGTNGGAIAGGIIGALVCIILVIAFIYFYRKSPKKTNETEKERMPTNLDKRGKYHGQQNEGYDSTDGYENEGFGRSQNLDPKNDNMRYYTDDIEDEYDEALPTISHSSDAWQLDRSLLDFHQFVGEGSMSQVWSALYRKHGTSPKENGLVAVKILKAKMTWDVQEKMLQEIQVMKSLDHHPNVLSLLACSTQTEPMMVVVEFASNGTLLNYLRHLRHATRSATSLAHLTSSAAQVVNAMHYISSHGLVHKDLAARSVMLDSNFVCKIADLTNKTDAARNHDKGHVPYRWMAPESLFGDIHTTLSDIWSMGVLLWEIITLGSTPWPRLTGQQVAEAIRSGQRMPPPPACPPTWYDMMCACWGHRPSQRLSWTSLRDTLEEDLRQFQQQPYSVITVEQLKSNISEIMTNMPGEKL